MNAAWAESDAPSPDRFLSLSAGLRSVAFYVFLTSLALAPFPLGSNRPWSWSLLCIFIAICWLLWSLSVWVRPQLIWDLAKGLIPPLLLVGIALAWTIVQISPLPPQSWTHPIWQLAAQTLERKTGAVISVAPWQTVTELMKLSSYAMVAWLARAFAERTEIASRLLNWLITVGALYCIYGFFLALLGQPQFKLFYGVPAVSEMRDLAGPFVNHNSYATYSGLIALCAGIRLVDGAWTRVEAASDPHEALLRAGLYVLGRGLFWLIATVLSLSTVIATGSRGGNLGTFSAIAVLVGLAAALAVRQARVKLAITSAAMLLAGVVALFAINGTSLMSRLDDMAATGLNENLRSLLWDAALRMVHSAPLTGLGLGTYQAAYPLYSTTVVPFVIDKAHNDYLELAAGWGLPAAICWWSALLWLMGLCLRGLFVRRRNRIYPMLAVGACILVGIHALFDFSLQMPAVALVFATILGLGVAQAFPRRQPAGVPL